MASIKVETIVTITDEQNKTKKFVISKSITSLTAIEERDYAISADATRTLWDPTNVTTEAVSDFDFALFWADGNLDLEMDIDSGGEVGREQNSIRLVKDLPLMLGADDAYANHSAGNAYGGTLDLIERFRVDEPASASRKLKAILAT